MLALSHVSKTYPGNPKPTLRDLSYSFPSHGLYFLVGKSGSGKSTLFLLLGAMDEDYEGEIVFDGRTLRERSPQEKEDYRFDTVSFAFQDLQVEEKDTVEEVLVSALDIASLSSSEKEERIEAALSSVLLREKKKARFSSLSGGEKKRVSLARALLRNNPVLLADEPLSSLNPALRRTVSDLLRRESAHRLVLVITHEPDEIPPEAGILSLSQGRLEEVRKPSLPSFLPLSQDARVPFSSTPFLRALRSTLLRQKETLGILFLTLAVSFFSVLFSFLLAFGVKESLSSSLSEWMSENSLVVRKREETVSSGYSLSSYQDLLDLKAETEGSVVFLEDFYRTNVDELLPEEKRISLLFRSRTMALEKLCLSSFLEVERSGELLDGERLYLSREETGPREVVLGMDSATLKSFYYLLEKERPEEVTEKECQRLLARISENVLTLRVQAKKTAWSYVLDDSYAVVGFVKGERNFLLSDDPAFKSAFVTDVLHFREYYSGQDPDPSYPAKLEKVPGVSLHPKKTGLFLRKALNSRLLRGLTFRPVTSLLHYDERKIQTHNRYEVWHDFVRRISVPEMEELKRRYPEVLLESYYSTPVYTFTANGYVSGFLKPFFFSLKKEKLNRLMDLNHHSEENLGSFQGQSFVTEEGVYPADLLSSLSPDGLKYRLLSPSLRLLCGKRPSSDREILLSEGFARTLFSSPEEALGESLYALTLVRTEKEGERFVNRFSEGSLRISGIVPEPGKALYQDSFFPLVYCFMHFPLDPSELRIEEALFRTDLERTGEEEILRRVKELGDYRGSFPMKEMLRSIEKTMKNLSLVFFALSVLSLFTSGALLSVSLLFLLEKEKKSIGVLLALGYRKAEILRLYGTYAGLLVLFGYVLGVFLSFFAERILARELASFLSSYVVSPVPYLIGAGLGLLLVLLVFLLLKARIAKLDPRLALKGKEPLKESREGRARRSFSNRFHQN